MSRKQNKPVAPVAQPAPTPERKLTVEEAFIKMIVRLKRPIEDNALHVEKRAKALLANAKQPFEVCHDLEWSDHHYERAAEAQVAAVALDFLTHLCDPQHSAAAVWSAPITKFQLRITLEQIESSFREECMRRARHFNRSTSPCSNLVEDAIRSAYAKFLDPCCGMLDKLRGILDDTKDTDLGC